MNTREAKIIIQMLRTEKMPTEVSDQVIASEALEWLKLKGWVVDTTKMSGSTTFQNSSTGREIAKMSDKQLLKELVDEHNWPVKIWNDIRGNVYFSVICIVILLILSLVLTRSINPWWKYIAPPWMQ
jgi:hypothetical protein